MTALKELADKAKGTASDVAEKAVGTATGVASKARNAEMTTKAVGTASEVAGKARHLMTNVIGSVGDAAGSVVIRIDDATGGRVPDVVKQAVRGSEDSELPDEPVEETPAP